MLATIKTNLGKSTTRKLRVLLDSGSTATLIKEEHVKEFKITQDHVTTWKTTMGNFTTNSKAKIQFKLSELHEKRLINWNCYITKAPMSYDMIIGQDCLKDLGIDIKFSSQTISWDGSEIPMKDLNETTNINVQIKESPIIQDATERMKRILDAKYEPANLDEVIAESSHLDLNQQKTLKKLLEKYKDLFDGTLGHWKGEDYHIELKPDAKPYHARAYPIPKAYEQTLKMEVDRLVKAGVLKKINHSEWAAPTFIIPKKDGTVRFISDFRELNKRIRRKPFPLPRIHDLLLKLEGFQYATSLDLNMGYYHIELDLTSRKLCTIVLPWGKYEYQRLPMGLCNSPDIFQEKMSSLMSDLENVRAYIDDLLILTKGDWNDHLEQLEEVLQRLRDAGLKINAKKSFFGKTELEYLGYWITREGIMPIPKKIEALKNVAVPTTKRQLRRFIGLINYYRDMWIRRSEILSPLSKLCSKTIKWQWTEEQQKAFELIKKVVSKEVLLSYPDFTKSFDIYTDASHTQLGAVISQNEKPIAFYSRKLNTAQTHYTTTERELLAIVETLKEFRNILLGQTIKVYTDHKNLTYKNFNTERVMRWRLIIEEYGPELIYLKGKSNIVADALSRLDILNESFTNNKIESMAEEYGQDLTDLSNDSYPLNYKTIMIHQQKDKELLELTKSQPHYHLKSFLGGRKKIMVICKNNKIVMPKTLQKQCLRWYHETLCHPGINRTEETINQHYTWKTFRHDVRDFCQKCQTCQRTKKSNKKYGKLPEKDIESNPWEILCVDLIGPYIIKRKAKKNLKLWCVTMIDPATSWFEIKEIQNKEPITIANKVEQTWLTRYPWPVKIIYDRGGEFLREFANMIEKDYGIQKVPTTRKNPQANGILERIHQTLGNIIRTFEVQEMELDENDPWNGILSATMFAIRATVHKTLQATPTQLVFGRDAILNIKFEANWNAIRQRKQQQIKKNNEKENKNRIPYQYSVGQKVWYQTKTASKYGENPWKGPYKILEVHNNGTVKLEMGAIIDTISIRLIKPYKE